MDRFEYVNWWGYSPAMDMLEELKTDSEDEVNILSFGAGDCRHILETTANLFKSNKNVNFYIVENCMEQYARHMLLMSVVLGSKAKMGIHEKSEVFLEVHGNTQIRKQTADLIEHNSQELLKMVTDYKYLAEKFPIFDLTNLKYKEKDFLESIFKYWRKEEKGDKFNMSKCWDFRLRSYLGTRYDAIPNVFDWHFHMKLADKDAEIIGSRNYIRWRKSGVAFELRDADYNATNKTLASAVLFKNQGDRISTRGYWGDIILSPFIAFGIESMEKSFFKKCNRFFTKTSEDVALYNLTRITYQIVHRSSYETPAYLNDTSVADSTLNYKENLGDETSPKSREEGDFISPDGLKIIFLPHVIPLKLHHNSKFHNFFHVVYFGNSQLQNFTEDLFSMFRDKSMLYFETAKFMLDLNREDATRFEQKIRETAEAAGCKGFTSIQNGAHLRFTFSRQSDSSVL